MTANEYNLWPVTPRLIPNPARIKENSPICAKLIPVRTAVRKSAPPNKAPNVLKIIFPITTTSAIKPTSATPRGVIAKVINIPDEVKKIALKRSRTGATNFSIRFTSFTSAKTAPIRKAPNATLNPNRSARMAPAKINPKTVMRRTSSIRVRLANRTNPGTSKNPPTATATKNAANFSRVWPAPNQLNSPVVPKLVSIPIIAMAKISSTIRTPKINRAKPGRKSPMLSKTLAIIVVDEMDRIAPRKIASIVLHPKSLPILSPKKNIPAISTTAVTIATVPTSFSFRKLKWSPTENMRRITPNSAKVRISSSFTTKRIHGLFGPITTPAKIYPKTTGCLSR